MWYTLLVVLLKHVLVGKAAAGSKLSSPWRLRRAGVFGSAYGVWQGLVGQYLAGTDLWCMVLRLLGVRIGRDCRLFDLGSLPDLDFVSLGDRVTVHRGAGVQAHTYEGRLLKRDFITVGDDVEINSNAIVLQDTVVQSRVVVHAATVILKGDVLDANTRWRGNPAQLVDKNWRIDDGEDDADDD